MSPTLDWPEILLRLGLTTIAGALVGLNRGEHGRPVGLRTTLLVCLAASISMIQVNLLLDMHGRDKDSFVMLDLMRLPLGILSGMGFIGAGAILHKERLVLGVTTAATLWYVTVMGLCFGGGQLGLGLIALVLGMGILSVLKSLEKHVKQDRRATVSFVLKEDGPLDQEIARAIQSHGFDIASWRVTIETDPPQRAATFVVHWRSDPLAVQPPSLVEDIARRPGVSKVEWID